MAIFTSSAVKSMLPLPLLDDGKVKNVRVVYPGNVNSSDMDISSYEEGSTTGQGVTRKRGQGTRIGESWRA